MGRILEAGAQGIMYPRCESAEEATELVRWAKFAPQGERGVDGANGDNPYCAMPMPPYLKSANDNTLLIAQIESPRALDEAEAIARVPGIDVLMLGPGDLSVIAGIPYQFDHPLITGAYERVAAAAKIAGKWWGTVSGGPEHTQRLFDLGAKFICHGCDLLMVKQGMEQIQQRYGELGFQFENRLAAEAAALAQRARLPLDAPPRPEEDARAAGPADPAESLGLTARERDVLRLVAAGRTNRQIAEELFISPKTASVHVSNILGKLAVATRGEAAALAHRLRLFPAEG
jgi:4-hydroxy-2-oxoheptanedioate aldolase